MLVRTATAEDADILYELLCLYRHKELPRDIFDGILKANRNDAHKRLALAVVDGKAVGFADVDVKLTISTCSLIATINDLFILEDYRRKKYGSGLLMSITSQMKTLGCSYVEICCNRVDIKAQSFLENSGYVKSRHLFVRTIE